MPIGRLALISSYQFDDIMDTHTGYVIAIAGVQSVIG